MVPHLMTFRVHFIEKGGEVQCPLHLLIVFPRRSMKENPPPYSTPLIHHPRTIRHNIKKFHSNFHDKYNPNETTIQLMRSIIFSTELLDINTYQSLLNEGDQYKDIKKDYSKVDMCMDTHSHMFISTSSYGLSFSKERI